MSSISSKNSYKNALAGAASGAIEGAINYPTEFVKTQQQLQRPDAQGKLPFKGPMDVIRHTFKTKGIIGFYRGVSSLIVGNIFKAGTRFVCYGKYTQLLKDSQGKLSPSGTFLAGILTGTTEALVAVVPAETIKVRFIDDSNRAVPRYRGLIHGTMTILRDEGPRGVYQGVAATVMRQAANSAVRFSVYDRMKQYVVADRKEKSFTAVESALVGVLAGVASTYATMPLDVTKTRLQGLRSSDYNGVFDCFRKILANEGVLAFWKGTTPRLARVAPSGGITFLSFEQSLKLLDKMWPEK
eukprot:g12080.t1